MRKSFSSAFFHDIFAQFVESANVNISVAKALEDSFLDFIFSFFLKCYRQNSIWLDCVWLSFYQVGNSCYQYLGLSRTSCRDDKVVLVICYYCLLLFFIKAQPLFPKKACVLFFSSFDKVYIVFIDKLSVDLQVSFCR